ncbi:gliding motility-associated C-terminal domain-containing protein [Ferruginibacter sp. SUN002]|uniref:T9SS type B sorting domain-containing protein n=1 Tax=Ferruginibacter sp. SUN002 TaxID=2937789 RepID=UPI003D35E60C
MNKICSIFLDKILFPSFSKTTLYLFIILIFSQNVSAQTPCNQREVVNIDFSYNGGGVAPTRWNVNQTDTAGFSIDQSAFQYLPTGNFTNVNLNPSGAGVNNTKREYAIVTNPNILSPQYASIPTDGMIVINPKQGENDEYGKFFVNGLVPGNTYNIEIKVWNVIGMAMPGACGSWCNWNGQLNTVWEGNGNNAHDGQGGGAWTGTNGSGGIDFWGNQNSNVMKISANGSYAIITGQMQLGNATNGFSFYFRKGSDINPVVLGIDYIKVYGCSQEAINVSGGSTNVCEGTDMTLTAQGLGPAKGASYTWYKNGSPLTGRTSDTLNIVSATGVGVTETYRVVGQWTEKTVVLTSKLCCSSVGGTSDEVKRQSFNGLTYSCPTGPTPDGSRHGGYADIPNKGVENFIDAAYAYAGATCNSLNDGQYAVVQSSYAGNFWQNRPEVKDHTGVAGSGALFINAIGGVGQVFYKFDLTGLCNATRYEFSVWYASLAASSEVKPNIEFAVMNGATKVESVTTGVIPENSKWYQATVTFLTPATGTPTYTLQLVNLVSGASGNDLMVDDIVVKKCNPRINLYQDGTKNDTLVVCSTSPVDLKVNTFYNLPLAITGSTTGTVYFQWMSSTSPTGPWTKIGTPETTGTLSAIPSATPTYYRAKVSADQIRAGNAADPLAADCGNDGMTSSFKLTKGGNFTIPPIAGTTTYCAGATMTLTGDAGTGDEWEWRKGPSVGAVLPGYAYSNNVAKKIYTKTAAASDGGDYYFFVRTAAGCEASSRVTVTVNSSVTPTFNAIGPLCAGAAAPSLPATSTNSIPGTWSPATVNTATVGTTTYTFTPNAGQCATTATLQITISAATVPAFNAIPAVCQGATAPTLPATSTNSITGTWSPATVSTATVGQTTYTFTPTTGQCATTTTLQITVSSPSTVPVFAAVPNVCQGATAPILPTSSTNGITGTWSPAVSTATVGTTTYTFTPGAGQCATTTTLQITVTAASTVPAFASIPHVCKGAAAPTFPTSSTNGITGTWSPVVSTATVGTTTYTFTPAAGQCATTTTLQITVDEPTIPAFAAIAPVCIGSSAPTLAATSTNGIAGTWNPATVSTATAGTTTYTFTPNAGQCATTTSLQVTVASSITPAFAVIAPICVGATPPALPTISTNNITGSWSPATINTATAGTATYTFTPDAGQCATASTTVQVTITTPVTPTFAPLTAVCQGATAPILPTTSTNGFTGTWSPAVSTATAGTATYTFTPNAGQCAATATIQLTVNAPATPTFAAVPAVCVNGAPPTLPTTSTNGFTGTWNPATVSTAVVGTATYTFTPTAGQCASSTTLQVTVSSPSTIPTFANFASVCKGSTPPVLPTSSTNGISGTWSPTVSTATVGTATYTFTPNAGQCAATTTAQLTITGPPNPPTTNASVKYCLNDNAVPLTATGTNLTWYDFSGTGTSVAPTPVTTTGGVATYFVTSSIGSCESEKVRITVNVNNVTAFAGGPILRVDEGKPTQINGIATGDNITILWSPATNLNSAAVQNPVINTTQDMNYRMTVTSPEGCSATDDLEVIVLRTVEIPNAFSPNGDGINDTWTIKYLGDYAGATVSIFNRYGQFLFETPAGAYGAAPWDGTIKGKPVPVGTYFYVIKLAPGKAPLSGSVSVIR